LALALLSAACTAAPPAPTPIPPPAPVPAPRAPAPAEERAIGSRRANASLLNVRSAPSLQGEVVGHARRGERVTILGESGEWLRVRTGGGGGGWGGAAERWVGAGRSTWRAREPRAAPVLPIPITASSPRRGRRSMKT